MKTATTTPPAAESAKPCSEALSYFVRRAMDDSAGVGEGENYSVLAGSIVDLQDAHAAAQQRIGELRAELKLTAEILALAQQKNWTHFRGDMQAMQLRICALLDRHPERT